MTQNSSHSDLSTREALIHLFGRPSTQRQIAKLRVGPFEVRYFAPHRMVVVRSATHYLQAAGPKGRGWREAFADTVMDLITSLQEGEGISREDTDAQELLDILRAERERRALARDSEERVRPLTGSYSWISFLTDHEVNLLLGCALRLAGIAHLTGTMSRRESLVLDFDMTHEEFDLAFQSAMNARALFFALCTIGRLQADRTALDASRSLQSNPLPSGGS